MVMNPSLIKTNLVLLSNAGGLILSSQNHACQHLSSDTIKDLKI